MRLRLNVKFIYYYGLLVIVCLLSSWNIFKAQGQVQSSVDNDLKRLMGKCEFGTQNFDECMKNVFNDLRIYFPTGVPDYNIRPFDPHKAQFIELRRGNSNGIGGFKIILRNVSEYGWTRSEVTKFRTDYANDRINYSQYFPEKSLDGWYEFSGKLFNTPLHRQGFWNLTLYDYSQTTHVRRLDGPGSMLKVRIEVDQIGGMKMHISDVLIPGNGGLNKFSNDVINSMWPIGLPVLKPIINELVSTAFTDIFNESFRYFPFEKFLA